MSKKTLAAKAKKPKAPKIKRFERRTLAVKHVFVASERLELGSKLAAAMQTHDEIKSHMDSIVADYKSRLKTVATEADQVAARIRDGYEMRELDCIVYFNTATNDKGKPIKSVGMKRIVIAHSKEFVRDEPMTVADKQTEMFEKQKLEAESKAAKAKAAKPDESQAKAPDAKDQPLNAPQVPKPGEPPASTAATA